MIKGWNYAGGKVPARYKTGTSGRKLQPVRQLYYGASLLMRPLDGLGNDGSFTRTFPPIKFQPLIIMDTN